MRKPVSVRRQKKTINDANSPKNNLIQNSSAQQHSAEQLKYQADIDKLKVSFRDEASQYQNNISMLEKKCQQYQTDVEQLTQQLDVETAKHKEHATSLDSRLKGLQIKNKTLAAELTEAQLKRAQHWDKLELSLVKEKLLVKMIEEKISKDQMMSNTFGFKINALMKFHSIEKLTADEFIALVYKLYIDFNSEKHLIDVKRAIEIFAEKVTSNKIVKNGIVKALSSKFFSTKQNKYEEKYLELKKFIKTEKNIVENEKTEYLKLSSLAYNEFLKIQESNKKNSKEVVKKKFELKKTKNIKVAVIMDEFSFNCFKDEFTPIVITPNNWKAIFEQEKPDLFFCESAWSGIDPIQRPWKGKIYSSINWKHENRKELLEILEHCKACGIETVFWNKEDPTHYPDRVHDFVKTATLFDYVFTTAEECVALYKNEYSLKNVYSLPFATSPKMFNPISQEEKRSDEIIFAGSWYANHTQRSKDMEKIFDDILNSHDIKIYDRYFGDDDPLHIYPEKYSSYINPGQPFSEMPKVYKESNIALTFNTVKDSKTMFARRAFELMSSNTLVLSNSSAGMDNLLKGLFLDIESNPNVLQEMANEEIEQLKSKALDCVLKKHTYRHRWNYILDSIGYKRISDQNSLTIVKNICNVIELESFMSLTKSCNLEEYKVLIILDDTIENTELQNLIFKYNNGQFNILSKDYLKKYYAGSEILDTSHFYMVENLDQNTIAKAEKFLAHSYYTQDSILMLDEHNKYKFKQGIVSNDFFSTSKNFLKLVVKGDVMNQNIFCLDEKVWGLK